MILVDTNVLSELLQPRPSEKVARFFDEQPLFHLSVVTLFEIEFGAAAAKSPDQEALIKGFAQQLIEEYDEQILLVSTPIALLAGDLRGAERKKGRQMSVGDALIAATALQHDLELATRNTKDFIGLGIALRNPFDE